MRQIEPNINILDIDLEDAGFTPSGNDQYIKTIKDYSKTLFDKAISYAEIDKAQIREVTHDHVKRASHAIANSYGRPSKPKWVKFVKAGQYLSTAFAGFALNYKPLGITGFFCFLLAGFTLFFMEKSNKNS